MKTILETRTLRSRSAILGARTKRLCAAYAQALEDDYRANWDSRWGPPDIPKRVAEFRAEAIPMLRAGGKDCRLAMGKPIPKRVCKILGIPATAESLSKFLNGE